MYFAARILADGVSESRSTHRTSPSERLRQGPPGVAPSLGVMAWSAPADRKAPRRVNACNSRARTGTLRKQHGSVHVSDFVRACAGASFYCEQPAVLLFLLLEARACAFSLRARTFLATFWEAALRVEPLRDKIAKGTLHT
ncbi:hypothetical protein MTO96_011399 [Rhipicephalus appendiculatus]